MEPLENVFEDKLHTLENFAAFYSEYYRYYTEGRFTNVTITCGQGREFKCHRLILIAASKYFENMFSSDWKEMRDEKIELPDIDGALFELVIQFVYKGRVPIDDKNVYDLLEVSDRFQVTILENLCVRYLTERSIPTDHAFDLFWYACGSSKSALIPAVGRFILDHLEQFRRDEDGLLSFAREEMNTLLAQWRPSSSRREHQLIEELVRWMSRHSVLSSADRESLWMDFMRALKFENISKDFLEQCLAGNSCSDSLRNVPNSNLPIQSNATKLISLHMYVRSSNPYDLFTGRTSTDDIDSDSPVKIFEPSRNLKTVAINDARLYLLQPKGVRPDRLAFSVRSSVSSSDSWPLGIPTDLQEYAHKIFSAEDFERVDVCSHSINPHTYWRHHPSATLSTNLAEYNCGIDKRFPIIKSYEEVEAGLITYLDGRLYTITGYMVEACDPRAGHWEKLANTQWPHDYWDQCCPHKGNIYVSCEVERKDRGKAYAVPLEVYDSVAGRWRKIHLVPSFFSNS